jgi:hypothetical protein
MTGLAPERRVGISQIAYLLAWARRLAEQPFDADPPERAAFHQAKTDLLTRLSADNNDPDPDPGHTTQSGGA